MFALKCLFRGQKGLFKVRRNPLHNPHKMNRELSIKRYKCQSRRGSTRTRMLCLVFNYFAARCWLTLSSFPKGEKYQ